MWLPEAFSYSGLVVVAQLVGRVDSAKTGTHRKFRQRGRGIFLPRGAVKQLRYRRAFVHVLLTRAQAEAGTAMPAYTHLQRAIPVTLGHHLLAWVEMLERDAARFAFARAQAEPSPLGAACTLRDPSLHLVQSASPDW